jgi:hypothetical protein
MGYGENDTETECGVGRLRNRRQLLERRCVSSGVVAVVAEEIRECEDGDCCCENVELSDHYWRNEMMT